jgi:transporter family protein
MWVLFSLTAAIFAALVVVLSKAGIQKVNPVVVFGIEAVCILLVTWSIIFIKGLQKELLTIDRRIWFSSWLPASSPLFHPLLLFIP